MNNNIKKRAKGGGRKPKNGKEKLDKKILLTFTKSEYEKIKDLKCNEDFTSFLRDIIKKDLKI